MPFQKGNTLSPGRPKNEDSLRNRFRMFANMSIEEIQAYRCKTTAELIAKKRILDATQSEDYRSIDSLADQLDGKPRQTVEQTITAPIEIIIDESEKDV